MADSHPYISGVKNISEMVRHLRKAFPGTISSDTVKKLGLAPKNESYVINALQFVGIIDADGKKTDEAKKVFSIHKDEDFNNGFSQLVKKAYQTLFDLHGEDAWKLEADELITFFRNTDETSHAIGIRQANTFKVFASLSGHRELPTSKAPSSKKSTPKAKTHKKETAKGSKTIINPTEKGETKTKDFGLTVRVEINLPADGTKETYDNIFKSIKENLINE